MDIRHLEQVVDVRYVYAQGYKMPGYGEFYGSTVQLGLRYKY